MIRLAVGVMALYLFAGCAGRANARPAYARGGLAGGGAARQDGAFQSLEEALRAPERARRLAISPQTEEQQKVRHLPPGLGRLVNLEALELSCLESLEDLPEEIGRLRKLQELVIDNGNGCSMNVSLPRSIGQLENLRVLRLYGALDPRDIERPRRGRAKALPDTLGDLRRLEELDLGRNGIGSLPPQVAALRRLKKLSLDYNEIRELPAFVGDLTSLEELSLNSNGGVRLPASLARVKGLKVHMGNNRLTLREQRALRARFPAATFFFENEYDDDAANQEAPKPRARRRR